MVKFQTEEIPTARRQDPCRLGANDDGVKLGANADGAKVLPRQRQLGVVGQVAWGLGANVNGAKLCYLDAQRGWRQALGPFFKIFPSGAYLRKSFEKRAKKTKKKKTVERHASLSPPHL
jgi:hypothetical protein